MNCKCSSHHSISMYPNTVRHTREWTRTGSRTPCTVTSSSAHILFMPIGKSDIIRVRGTVDGSCVCVCVFNSVLMSPTEPNEYQLMLINKLNCLDWWTNYKCISGLGEVTGLHHLIMPTTSTNLSTNVRARASEAINSSRCSARGWLTVNSVQRCEHHPIL